MTANETISAVSPPRSAGVLLHPTSLPGRFGIGDLGPSAYEWVNTLARAKQKWWQVLPLGPTGFGDSPYQCFSAFAGNPYLVSPEKLVQEGLLAGQDIAAANFPGGHIEYGPVIQFKIQLLLRAWSRFQSGAAPLLQTAFAEFCAQQADWLDDFALFMAIKDARGGASWLDWPHDLVVREPQAVQQARKDLADAINQHKFRQFLFFRQWSELKAFANNKAIRLIGDVPIFTSSDSADVWANPDIFLLDERRRPRVVAGVPPDYFSQTGQLWGNPLYDWQALRRSRYAWWVGRLRAMLVQVDLIRLDHFRGFEAYWEVPAGMPTAQVGRWVKGPGVDLFHAVRQQLGRLPLIAEDLGVITPAVEQLRTELGLPGMRILQFAFVGAPPEARFLPHNFERNTVVYTGTHDNDTTRGWYAGLDDARRYFLHRYLSRDGRDITWDMIRLAWSSVADYAIVPLQDVLDLGPEARMNFPGRSSGNWIWRYDAGQFSQALVERLGEMTEIYQR
jgi:4-alpha-glucanotransferase